MGKIFKLASGTVMGRSHSLNLGNNQDASCYEELLEDGSIVIVVADGCSDSDHSEVGAAVISRLALQAGVREYLRGKYRVDDPRFWEGIRSQVISRIQILATDFGGSFTSAISDYFLATIVMAIITPSKSVFAAIGDGVFVVNGELIVVEPAEGNFPPYPAHRLIETTVEFKPEDLLFSIKKSLETANLESFVIASDGLLYLINASEEYIPGREPRGEKVGDISQFWLNDHYFRNPDAVRRFLRKVNTTKEVIDWESGKVNRCKGLLDDDTTLVVGRRVI